MRQTAGVLGAFISAGVQNVLDCPALIGCMYLSTDLDPNVWRPMWKEMEDIIAATKQQEDEEANPCSICRGTGGVRIRWPDGKVTTVRWG